MLICYINKEKFLRQLEILTFNPKYYKGIRVGDTIQVPMSRPDESVSGNWVVVTGFTRDLDIVHYKYLSIYANGIGHSGCLFDDIIRHNPRT